MTHQRLTSISVLRTRKKAQPVLSADGTVVGTLAVIGALVLGQIMEAQTSQTHFQRLQRILRI
jgi:hypothetical protein